MVSNVPLKVLIDSRCTCSFINQHLVSKILCIISSIDPPVELQLFDGSVAPNEPIHSYVDLDFMLPGSFTDCFPFLVTWLDSSCSMALGYDWLFTHNPNINWRTGRITLHNLSTAQIDICTKCNLHDCKSAKAATILSCLVPPLSNFCPCHDHISHARTLHILCCTFSLASRIPRIAPMSHCVYCLGHTWQAHLHVIPV